MVTLKNEMEQHGGHVIGSKCHHGMQGIGVITQPGHTWVLRKSN